MTPPEEMTKVGRIALRQEGGNWNAYWAQNGTMENAVFIGSIKMSAIVRNKERKQQFIELMRGTMADIVEERFGIRPAFDIEPAPEHERSGNG